MTVERVVAPTEERNPRTENIDLVGTRELLGFIADEDERVAPAVRAALPELEILVRLGLRALRAGGRIHYIGAGASGRVGALDAAELVPTYAIPADLVIAHLAGGLPAMVSAFEGVEDDIDAGYSEIFESANATDLVVGIAASGRTPFVAGGLRAARAIGASTGLVSAHPDAPLAELCDVHVALDTGPEAIAGSTRMKAASAQKMAMNAFSTAVMVQSGRTYSNLMIDVEAMNGKLRGRLRSLLMQATGCDEVTASTAIETTDGDVKVALVHLVAGTSPDDARRVLAEHDGRVRPALSVLMNSTDQDPGEGTHT